MNSMEEIIKELREGLPVVVMDRQDRENEGDLVLPAEKATPEWINFMMRECKGMLCVAMTNQRFRELNIPEIENQDSYKFKPPMGALLDLKTGTTGSSSYDRAATLRALADPSMQKEEFSIPGHVAPLKAKPHGVLERQGHTEAAVDLMRLAGLQPCAALCEILNRDGTMARRNDLRIFCEMHRLKMTSVEEIIDYRLRTECLVHAQAETPLPTQYGQFQLKVYRALNDPQEHIALIKGDVRGKTVLTRIHSSCFTGDTLRSLRCDCWGQLNASLELLAREESGVLVYLAQEGRGIGLLNKIKAYALQDQGLDTVEANTRLGLKPDQRDYWIAAQILKDLGVIGVRLLTNNPEKVEDLQKYGIPVLERVALIAEQNAHNAEYIVVKKQKLGHLL